MFDFPDVPTANQTISTPEGVQYVWTGSKWTLVVASGLDQATADGLYANITGDTFTGPVTATILTSNGDINSLGDSINFGATADAFLSFGAANTVLKGRGVGVNGISLRNAADVSLLTVHDQGLALGGATSNYLLFENTAGGFVGPFIQGSNAVAMSFRTGTADLGFAFENNAGAQLATINSQGIHATTGIISLAAVAGTFTPTQPSIFATLGSLQIFAPTVGIYFSEINTGVDWMWINEGGLMNATGVYHGISSLGTPATGGPLIYMHVDQSVFTLGSGLIGGGTSTNPDFVWRDFAANQLMGLNNEGDLNLFTPGPTPRKYLTIFTDILSGTYSSMDIYGDTGPNYGATIQAGAAAASFISWNYVTLAHPPINFMHGLGISMTLSTTMFESKKEAYKPVAGPWLSVSDIRMKQNVADYTAGLAAILQLRPVTYQFNGLYGSEADGATHIGLVADEVEAVMPEMVGEMQRAANPPPVMVSRDGNDLPPYIPAPAPDPASLETIKTLDVGPLTYAIVNALKEISDRLDALEAAGGVLREAATPAPQAPVRPTQQPAPPPQRPAPAPRRR
jgi:hypothetical protein